MRKIWQNLKKFLKKDSDDSVANFYKFIGYVVVAFQIFLWSQAFWLSLIETVNILKIIIIEINHDFIRFPTSQKDKI